MMKKEIKVGVLIPDRGDRREFLFNCWRMLTKQTMQPVRIELVNDKPITDKADITWRYRKGYNRFCREYSSGQNPDKTELPHVDIIVFMENDDWYSPKYIETMVAAWDAAGRPDIFGTNYTIYYHIKLRKYFKMTHFTRASAMNTLIKPNLSFPWPADHDPYTDAHLWQRIKGGLFTPEKHISIGIKHGEGMTGGHMHVDRMHRYIWEDNGFLRDTLDPESFEFYDTYFARKEMRVPTPPGDVIDISKLTIT